MPRHDYPRWSQRRPSCELGRRWSLHRRIASAIGPVTGNSNPGDLPSVRDSCSLENAFTQVAVDGRTKSVESPVILVLCQVDRACNRIDSCRLMDESPKAGTGDALTRVRWITFPDKAAAIFLARKPRPPRCRAASAVPFRIGKDAVRIGDVACRVEVDRAHSTSVAVRFGVGDIDPASSQRESSASVGRKMPGVRSARHQETSRCNEPRRETRRQPDAICIRRAGIAIEARGLCPRSRPGASAYCETEPGQGFHELSSTERRSRHCFAHAARLYGAALTKVLRARHECVTRPRPVASSAISE
jgi:hypothetical protein